MTNIIWYINRIGIFLSMGVHIYTSFQSLFFGIQRHFTFEVLNSPYFDPFNRIYEIWKQQTENLRENLQKNLTKNLRNYEKFAEITFTFKDSPIFLVIDLLLKITLNFTPEFGYNQSFFLFIFYMNFFCSFISVILESSPLRS